MHQNHLFVSHTRITCFSVSNFRLQSRVYLITITEKMGRLSCTIYVGNLPGDIRMREVEDLFYKYGPIRDIDLKIPPRPPGYAFVEFEDPRDAEDAIRGRDGCKFDGHRLRVELAHGGRSYSSSVDRYSSYSGSSSRGASRRSDYRVLVTGLPSSASWQDLKDHMRKAGDVCFSQVFRDRGGMRGIVDYTNYEDMKYAIRKLDDSEFRNAFSRSYVRVREYDKWSYSRGRSYSRSPSYSRGRSYSLSPSYSRGRSYSRSPSYSRGRSYSRSPSYSRGRRYSRSPSYSRGRSYSRSPSYSKGRSYSRSPSRSNDSRSPSPRAKSSFRSRSRSRSRSKSPVHSHSRRKRESQSVAELDRSRSPATSSSRSCTPL